MTNEIDKRILKILQENSRTTNAEIARQVGMAPSAIMERIRKLEERGVIKGYGAQLAGHAIGRGLLAFIFVRLEDMMGESKAAKAMARMSGLAARWPNAAADCFSPLIANTAAIDVMHTLPVHGKSYSGNIVTSPAGAFNLAA